MWYQGEVDIEDLFLLDSEGKKDGRDYLLVRQRGLIEAYTRTKKQLDNPDNLVHVQPPKPEPSEPLILRGLGGFLGYGRKRSRRRGQTTPRPARPPAGVRSKKTKNTGAR